MRDDGLSRQRQIPGPHDLAADGFHAIAVADLEIDGLAFVAPQQRFERDRVGPVALLQNLQHAPARAAQHHGLRLQLGSRAREFDSVDTSFQVERNCLAHNGELLVVNRERGIGGKGVRSEKAR
ncbi:MAG: hypothetical protein ABSH32_30775 [Bryobacteraceae bacterium]